MTTRTIRTGIIGYGKAGAIFHGALISSTPGFEVAAISTSDPKRQAAARANHPNAAVYPKAEALLDDASLELVVIASPNRTHAPLALAALDRGRAVVVDKPFAVTSAEARAVVERAAQVKRPVTVFHNRRWDGDFLTAGKLIAVGRLGKVIRWESRFEIHRRELRGGWKEQAGPDDGVGVLYDLGSHLIDQTLALFGKPSLQYAEVQRARANSPIDDDDFLALRFPGGELAHLWMSYVPVRLGARLRVVGTEGVYEKYGFDVQEEQLYAGVKPGSAEYGHDPRERWGRLYTAKGEEVIPTDVGCHHAFYAQLAAALRGEAPLPIDPMDAVTTLSIIEAAHAAGASRTP